MVEMAASASASLAARSLAAIVPGAGSWRNEAVFGQLGGHAARESACNHFRAKGLSIEHCAQRIRSGSSTGSRPLRL
jgi:hypothetical protein